ncbi:hypothetical protein LJC02_01955 [Breznakia sp. OttesenSCG-928-G09]|nr:hypothetical protein [Breznakia sp. OttesenSCG-928-G09]
MKEDKLLILADIARRSFEQETKREREVIEDLSRSRQMATVLLGFYATLFLGFQESLASDAKVIFILNFSILFISLLLNIYACRRQIMLRYTNPNSILKMYNNDIENDIDDNYYEQEIIMLGKCFDNNSVIVNKKIEWLKRCEILNTTSICVFIVLLIFIGFQ